MVFMKSLRRTFKTQSTKYSSSRGAAKARWPLKRTRSKQESTATIKLVNLVMKRDSVFMAFSSGRGLVQTPFWRENASLAHHGNLAWINPEPSSRDLLFDVRHIRW